MKKDYLPVSYHPLCPRCGIRNRVTGPKCEWCYNPLMTRAAMLELRKEEVRTQTTTYVK